MAHYEHDRAKWPSKKRLYELYWGDGKSFREVATAVDSAVNAVERMFNYYGIPSRQCGSRFSGVMYANGWARTPLPSPYDTDWMHRRLRDDGLSVSAIARELDVRKRTVADRLRTANLHPDTESFGEKPYQNREWLWRQFRRDRRSTSAVAVSIGMSKRSVRHWSDKHDIQRPDGRWSQVAQASVAADRNDELSDAAKKLDPTIKSTETPDEMVDDTLSIGTNVGSGRYSQR